MMRLTWARCNSRPIRGHDGGVGESVDTPLSTAREAFAKAAVAYEEAVVEVEAAAGGDASARSSAFARVNEAAAAMARAQAAVQALTPAPEQPARTFERVIASGLVGFDVQGDVLASIFAYQHAPSYTMSAPAAYHPGRPASFHWFDQAQPATG